MVSEARTVDRLQMSCELNMLSLELRPKTIVKLSAVRTNEWRLFHMMRTQLENRRSAMFVDEDCVDGRSDVDDLDPGAQAGCPTLWQKYDLLKATELLSSSKAPNTLPVEYTEIKLIQHTDGKSVPLFVLENFDGASEFEPRQRFQWWSCLVVLTFAARWIWKPEIRSPFPALNSFVLQFKI